MKIIERIESNTDLNELMKQIRLVRGETHEDVEHRVGLTRGHLGKIENGEKTWGKQIINMTPTADWLLEAYGLRLLLVDHDTAEALAEPVVKLIARPHRQKETLFEHPTRTRLSLRLSRRPETPQPQPTA